MTGDYKDEEATYSDGSTDAGNCFGRMQERPLQRFVRARPDISLPAHLCRAVRGPLQSLHDRWFVLCPQYLRADRPGTRRNLHRAKHRSGPITQDPRAAYPGSFAQFAPAVPS